MIRKRLLSACLALALCLGLLPATALAAEGAPGSLYVAGQQITDEGYYTQSGGNWTKSGDASTPPSAPYFHYTKGNDNTPATLTLSGATIQGGTSTGSVPYGAGIYAQCNSGESVSLTIELIGENTITGYYGIYVNAEMSANSYGTDASLNITGNGSLIVTGTNSHGLFVKSGTGNASLNIKNVAVTSSTNGDYAAGVYVMSSMYATNSPKISLSVDGGSLTASGTGSSDGILFYVGLSQATGATTRLTVSGNAIVDARNGGIKATRVSTVLPTPTPTGENSSGIVFDGTEGTVYGDVTLQEDLEIGTDETLTIPEGSTLNTNNKLTNNGTIVNTGGTLNGEPGGTIVSAPAITTQPQDKSVTAGNTATFTVAASGENLSYQWQQKTTDSGSDWTNVGSATSSNTYTIDNTTTNMSGYQYRCVVSNSAGSVTSEVATLTVNEPAPTTYTITADVTPLGAGTATADKTTATAGDTVKLTATANSGYRFVGWTFSDNITGADSSSANTTFTMPAGNVTVTANFKQVYTVTVNASAGGTATADKTTAAAGEAVTLTAKPDSGYRLARWEVVKGDVTITGNRFIMPAENVTVRAVFSPVVNIPDTHEIELIVGEGGEAKLSLTNASVGSTITVTVTPDEGFELDYITVDGERIDGTTFTMPEHDVTVRVYFTNGSATLPFTDVSTGAWYFDAVSYVYANGLMDGVSDTLFDPDGTMTRAMVWAILARVDGETVTGTNWIETAREWAMANGVSDGENASGYVTREQLATMLYRYAVYKGYDVSIGEDTNILSYADFADLSEYAIPAMQWACGAGIITGVTDSTLVPQGTATRAQCAAMLMRFVEANS